jgi:hypothetical protein
MNKKRNELTPIEFFSSVSSICFLILSWFILMVSSFMIFKGFLIEGLLLVISSFLSVIIGLISLIPYITKRLKEERK